MKIMTNVQTSNQYKKTKKLHYSTINVVMLKVCDSRYGFNKNKSLKRKYDHLFGVNLNCELEIC